MTTLNLKKSDGLPLKQMFNPNFFLGYEENSKQPVLSIILNKPLENKLTTVNFNIIKFG